MFDKKEKPLQEVFFKKEIPGRTKEKVFQEKEMEIPQEEAIHRKTSKVCFVCRKPGHFAKNCQKREKVAKLLERAQIHVEDTPFSDVESLYLLDDEYSPQALVVMGYSTT